MITRLKIHVVPRLDSNQHALAAPPLRWLSTSVNTGSPQKSANATTAFPDREANVFIFLKQREKCSFSHSELLTVRLP